MNDTELNGAAPGVVQDEAPIPASEFAGPKKKKKSGGKKKAKAAAPAKKAAKKAAKKGAAKKAAKPAKERKTHSGERRGPGSSNKVVRHGNPAYAARLKKARLAKDWTQREAAAKLGMTQPGYCNLEKSTTNPGEEKRAKIFKVLGVK